MINVMVCDDLQDIRDFFVELINQQPDMHVVCTADDTQSCISNAEKYKPDIILLDVQLDEYKSGIIAAEKIVDILPETKIIMLTIHNNDELVIESYLAGAVGYIEKSTPPELICDLVREAYSQPEFLGNIISNALRRKINNTRRQYTSLLYIINRFSKLTPMETEILKLLYKRKTRNEMAKEKYLSEETIKTHIRHILKKMGCTSTAELLKVLEELGITNYFNM